jgi:hypothetical protein
MNINSNHETIDPSNAPPLPPPPHSASGTQSINHQPVRTTGIKTKKKCHGNKRLQRFRKRRRARGMTEVAINKTIEARKREKEKQHTKKAQQGQDQHQQKTTTSIKVQPLQTVMLAATNVISVGVLHFN